MMNRRSVGGSNVACSVVVVVIARIFVLILRHNVGLNSLLVLLFILIV